jgi:hypothetical protein
MLICVYVLSSLKARHTTHAHILARHVLLGNSPRKCHPAAAAAATCASIYPAIVRSSGFNLAHNMAMSWLGEWNLLLHSYGCCCQHVRQCPRCFPTICNCFVYQYDITAPVLSQQGSACQIPEQQSALAGAGFTSRAADVTNMYSLHRSAFLTPKNIVFPLLAFLCWTCRRREPCHRHCTHGSHRQRNAGPWPAARCRCCGEHGSSAGSAGVRAC